METEYLYEVIKLFHKMKDGDIFTPNLKYRETYGVDHPNSAKFIEAVKWLIDHRVPESYTRAFTITFNNDFTKIKRNDYPRPSIWEPYYKKAADDKIRREEECKNPYPYKFVSIQEWQSVNRRIK